MPRLIAALITMIALTARAAEPFLEDTGHRFRWGISAGMGSSVGRGGVAFEGELRLGYQHSRRFNLFGTAGVRGSVSDVSGGQVDLGAVAEFTLVDWFYFGAGLVASYGSTTVLLGQSPFSYFQDASSGFRPALDLRLGFSTGESLPPFFSRGGFNIGVHALLMLHPNTTLVTSAPSGVQSYTPNTLQVTFTPVLTLGFDSR
jgi:hypothetical protein